jgi:Zn-finger nucleic acid-binding protein
LSLLFLKKIIIMNCPTCKDVQLVMSERQQIEIDYCPNCRGIWLDRGELDKLIERSASMEQKQNQSYSKPHEGYSEYKKYDEYKKHDDYKHHKKKSWLSDLFD